MSLDRPALIRLERLRLFYRMHGLLGLGTLLLSAAVFVLQPTAGAGSPTVLPGGLLLVGLSQAALWYFWQRLEPETHSQWSWKLLPAPILLLSGIIWGALAATALPLQATSSGLLLLLCAALGGLLSALLLAAIELMAMLFFVAFLGALLAIVKLTDVSLTSTLVLVLLTAVIGLGITTIGISQLCGVIAGLRAGKRTASGKLNLARVQRDDLEARLSSEDARRQQAEQALHLAKEAAETANMVKSEFLATMSHEIRTPLNGILPLLEILRESRLDREQKQCVQTALNSSYHLLGIINDILDFSKIEAGKLDLESIEINPRELVQSVVAMMGKSAERRGLTLEYRVAPEVPARVQGDPIRLRQILTNLVSNAIKFTSKGGVSVDITCQGRSRKTVEIAFAVKDSGSGIGPEVQQRLFHSFNQADASTTRKHGGTGLGLVICKRLVGLMGGKIGVKSEVGKGSVFWFVVPLRKAIRDIPADRHSLKQLRVLLLDRDDRSATQISQYLTGWETLHQRSEDALDALAKLNSTATLGRSWAYELLIIESRTLRGGLKDFLHEIGDSPLLGGLKLLLITDESDARDLPGVDGVVARPLKEADLYRILCRLLDVQPASGEAPRRPDEMVSNPFLYSESQAELWPESEPESEPAPTLAAWQGTRLRGRVLVVEDNQVNLNVAKKIVQRLGLACDEARDGLAALTAIETGQYDLVLMDCQMPRLDGYEATRAIRLREETHGLARVPIIAMTANAMRDDRQKCLDAGMDDYLSKPVMPDTFRIMLCKWLAQGEPTTLEAPARTALPEEAVPLAEAMVIDRAIISELQQVMGDDLPLLLKSFLDSAPDQLREIEAGLLGRDPQRIVRSAHSLKSSSANLGALQLSSIAQRIEQRASEDQLPAVKRHFATLTEAYALADAALQRLCKQDQT